MDVRGIVRVGEERLNSPVNWRFKWRSRALHKVVTRDGDVSRTQRLIAAQRWGKHAEMAASQREERYRVYVSCYMEKINIVHGAGSVLLQH